MTQKRSIRPRRCPECRETFIPSRPSQRFDRPECRHAFWIRRHPRISQAELKKKIARRAAALAGKNY